MTTKTPPPPSSRSKAASKGQPPQKTEIKDNLTKPEPENLTNLGFRVTAEFKRNFKIAAANHGISQLELLKRSFALWEKENG